VALASSALLGLGFVGLHALGTGAAGLWLLIASCVYILFLIHLGVRVRGASRRASDTPPPHSLGPANLLTLLRALMAAMMAGFVALPGRGTWVAWIPGLLYLLVVVGDAFDGWVARRTGTATELGGELDMATDRVAFLTAVAVAVAWGRLHPVFLGPGFLPLLFAGHMSIRRGFGSPVHPLAHRGSRQLVGTLYTLFLVAALLPLFSPPRLILPGVILTIPLVLGFARDWLHSVRGVDGR
jgi:phosphatidylglycerophosphate synthase